jgi:C1A family cysteine protease
MKTLLFGATALTLTLITIFALTKTSQNNLRTQFINFKTKYNKSYGSKSELEYRFSIFKDNMNLINSSNADKTKSFTLGINQFTDITFEEFKNQYLMQPRENIHHSTLQVSNLKAGSVDWRKVEGAVGKVKNQGQCGSCWAFSTVAALETAYALRYDSTIIFSEQELVDCSSEYGNHGCNGGLMPFAFEYIMDNQISTGKDYPYTGKEGTCRASSITERFPLDSFAQIDPVNVDGLMEAIETTVVSVAIEVQNDLMFYHGGVYHASQDCGRQLNHGVAAVGYNTQGSEQYFIVRNSWGSDWGIGGYVNMSIGTETGTCGIANPTDSYPLYR